MFDDSITLKWQGEKYECPVTMSLIKRLERAGVNILETAIELDKGGIPKISLVSELYAALLQEGGCDVSEEDVYTSIMSDPASSGDLVLSAKVAVNMFFPKIEAPERTSKKVKKS